MDDVRAILTLMCLDLINEFCESKVKLVASAESAIDGMGVFVEPITGKKFVPSINITLTPLEEYNEEVKPEVDWLEDVERKYGDKEE